MLLALVLAAVVLSVTALQIVLYTVLPVLTGVVTKEVASARVKAIVLMVLTAVATLIIAAVQNDGLFTDESLLQFVTGLVVGIATYLGVWKPIGVTEAVNTKTASFGVGPRT